MTDALSPLQRTVLELEAMTWPSAAAKQREFRRRHPGVTEAGYHLALARLLDNPAAEQRFPHLIHRLRRLRAAGPDVRPG